MSIGKKKSIEKMLGCMVAEYGVSKLDSRMSIDREFTLREFFFKEKCIKLFYNIEIYNSFCCHFNIYEKNDGFKSTKSEIRDRILSLINLNNKSYTNPIITNLVSFKRRMGGRTISKGVSLQNMAKPIRMFLVNGLYVDIDIKNCHPCILNQLSKKIDLPSPHLDMYSIDRESLFVTFSSEIGKEVDFFKDFFIKMMFSGKMNINNMFLDNSIRCATPLEKTLFYEFCKGFQQEIMNIYDLLLDEYFPLFRGRGKMYNREGSYLSLLCQIIESWVIDCIVEELIKTGFIVDNIYTPVFDGVMFPKGKRVIDKEILSNISKAVFLRTGFMFELKEKKISFTDYSF